jgi:hypothetical protein
MTFDFRYPTPLPSTKGWGSAWPTHDLRSIMVTVPPFAGGFHPEIAELVTLLVREMKQHGFEFVVPGCWGFAFRGTKSSSGSTGGTPSFHSWGLSPDINAPRNPFGNDRSNTELGQPQFAWVDALWRSYGFFWLGPPIRDWMHWSFVGSPADAKAMTAKAQRELGDDMSTADMRQGGALQREGKPLPHDANADMRYGYNLEERIEAASKKPLPGTPGPHEHNLEGKAT